MDRKYPYITILILACFLSCSNSSVDPWKRAPEILKDIKAPDFPNIEFNIIDYGARGNQNYDCTESIKQAISACHKAGGGKIIIPAGIYMTGPIHLMSNVNLHLEENAVLKFYFDPEKYLPLVFSRWEGVELMNYSPLVYAYGQENIAITGKGTLDGQAGKGRWWDWRKNPTWGWQEGKVSQSENRNILFEMAENKVPVKERVFPDGSLLSPPFVQLYNCKSILIDGITIINSPMWHLHTVLSQDITIQNLNISSFGPNSDGCIVESCKDVIIQNCKIRTQNDCISLKSGRNEDGRRINIPTENVIIDNCNLQSGIGAFTIGSETSGGIQNAFIKNCQMTSPYMGFGIRLKSNSLRGGLVRNVHFKNIEISQVSNAVISLSMYYNEGDAGSHNPTIENFTFENIKSYKSSYGLILMGYTDSEISNIQFKNCTFQNVENGNCIINVKNISAINTTTSGEKLPNIKELKMPKQVRNTLNKELGNGIVERLMVHTYSTGVRYEFRILVNGLRRYVFINQDGRLL